MTIQTSVCKCSRQRDNRSEAMVSGDQIPPEVSTTDDGMFTIQTSVSLGWWSLYH